LTYELPAPQPGSSGWRLVVSDLDGTLLDQNSLITSENLAAVSWLKKLGVGFTVATGRTDRMARNYIRQLGITLPVIASNGAMIRDCRTGLILRRENLPAREAEAFVRSLLKQKIDFLLYDADDVWFPEGSARIEAFRQYNQRPDVLPEERLRLLPLDLDAIEEATASLIKIVAVVPDSAAKAKVRMMLSGLSGLDNVLSGDEFLETIASGVSKGTALSWLASFLGIQVSEIIAFGDHDNDEDMLATAGLGIAMANATPAALQASQLVTYPHGESGVAAAIYHLFGSPARMDS
jgi:Cof subfamily protein (haloacid dehalogenase superfamily)